MEENTINAFLLKNLRLRASARLAELLSIGAPTILIDSLKAAVQGDGGLSSVGEIAQFGPLSYATFEKRKYRRGTGIVFLLADGSKVYLIPGPYGLFLTDKDTP